MGQGLEVGCHYTADVKGCLQKVQTLKYAEEVCYNGTLLIKALSSGLEIGSCNWSLKGPKRNISYISSSVISSGTATDFDFHSLQGSDVLIYSDFSSLNVDNCVENENSVFADVTKNCSTKSDNTYTMDLNSCSLLNFEEGSEELEKLNFICSCSLDSVKAGGSVLIPIGTSRVVCFAY